MKGFGISLLLLSKCSAASENGYVDGEPYHRFGSSIVDNDVVGLCLQSSLWNRASRNYAA